MEVNQAQFGVAQASLDSAAAALQTANIQLGYTDIRALIAGRISRTLVTKGNLVGQDQPTMLTTIVSMDPVFVYFDAPNGTRPLPADGPRGQESAVEIGVAYGEGFPHAGTIDFQENRVDVGTGTVRSAAGFPTRDGSKGSAAYPGLYARIRVPAGPPARPVIPEEALMTGQEGRFVSSSGRATWSKSGWSRSAPGSGRPRPGAPLRPAGCW